LSYISAEDAYECGIRDYFDSDVVDPERVQREAEIQEDDTKGPIFKDDD
jgi:hypothetical protein